MAATRPAVGLIQQRDTLPTAELRVGRRTVPPVQMEDLSSRRNAVGSVLGGLEMGPLPRWAVHIPPQGCSGRTC